MKINSYKIDDTLLNCICTQIDDSANIYPSFENRFKALELTPLNNVKVVILGQDPYHGEGQANGLCFSVGEGIKLPPSLRNIYKEIESDLNIYMPKTGNLTPWAKQGVLLLNSVLSVEKSKPASHAKIGWEEVTDSIIQQINNERENVVFMLWGAYAQKKGALIDRNKHLVLETTHPSPFSAHKGFLGCGHFSKANTYLISKNMDAINWEIEEHSLFSI